MPSPSYRGLSPPTAVSVDGSIGNSVSIASLDWLSIGWPPAWRPSLSVEYTSDASASVPDVAVSEAGRPESAAGGSPKSATDSPGAASTESSEVAPDSSPAGVRSATSAAASTLAAVSPFVGAESAPDVASSFAGAFAGCGGVYGALGRAACQSASALPRNLRAATAATPTSAARMANLVNHLLFFFFGGGRTSAPLPVAGVASPLMGEPAATLSALTSFGIKSSERRLPASRATSN